MPGLVIHVFSSSTLEVETDDEVKDCLVASPRLGR